MATSNDSRDQPMAEPGKRQTGAPAPPTRPAAPANPTGATRPQRDDEEEQWRHAPVAPRDEGILKSLGQSVSEVVTGSLDDRPAKPRA
jgi:hypothetical protein